jgi:hypothetical protein
VEPLPKLETILWTKDNGKIVPNSRHSILDVNSEMGGTTKSSSSETSDESSSILEGADSSQQQQQALQKIRNLKNFRVKVENLTLFDQKGITSYENNEDDYYLASGGAPKSAQFEEVIGVTSTDGHAVGLTRSLLTIKSLRKQDFGLYKCKSSNSYGSRVALILLREKTLMGTNTLLLFIFI